MGDMKLNKRILIAGIAAVLVVVGGGVGGALLALNTGSNSADAKNNNKVQNAEKVSVDTTKTEKNPNGWRNENNGWYFYKNDEKQTGWMQNGDAWYYLGSDGEMKTGWIQYKNKSYYLDYEGSMVIDTTIDGCYLNDSGLIEDLPKAQKQSNKGNSEPSKSDGKITVDGAKDLIYSNIDANDRVFLINGQAEYITEVTPNSGDGQAQKIYDNLGVKENMYKFNANYNSSFFVSEDSGATYLFDGGGKIGSGFYVLESGKRTDSWRIGEWNDNSYIAHSSNGDDWAKL